MTRPNKTSSVFDLLNTNYPQKDNQKIADSFMTFH